MVAVLHAAPGSAAPHAVEAWLASLLPVYGEESVRMFAEACAALREAARRRAQRRRRAARRPRARHRFDPRRPPARPGLDPRRAADAVPGAAGLRRGKVSQRATARRSRRSWRGWHGWATSARCPPAQTPAERLAQAENLRKMLLAMVEDVRVVLIKLAERTQALRFLIGANEERGAPGRPRSHRPVRAARQPPRRLAAQVGARGPLAARARARRSTSAIAQVARRAAPRPPALHRRRDRAS